MIDRLKQLAIFSKTIDHGSFRGAAAELNLSPSVVSHHISQLEDQLGVALIYRSTRKLRLTPEGERLLSAAHRMLAAVEGELADLSAEARDPSGTLRITVPSVLSQSEFVEKIADFARAYPRIELTLDFSDTKREMIGDDFDLAVRMSPKAKNSATTRKLFAVHRVIVGAPDYLAKRPEARRPEDLRDRDWVSLVPAHKAPIRFSRDGARGIDLRIKPTLKTNDAQALYKLARAGVGLAVVPEYLARADLQRGHMVQVLPDWDIPQIVVSAEWPANAPKHGLVHLALNALSEM